MPKSQEPVARGRRAPRRTTCRPTRERVDRYDGTPCGKFVGSEGGSVSKHPYPVQGVLRSFRTRYWKGFVVETDSVRGGPFEEARQPRNCSEGEGANRIAKIPKEYTGMDPVPTNMKERD